jgi:CBS domain-containing protein
MENMAGKAVGALLVMSGGKLLGFIAKRDYARKVILKGKSFRVTLVREVMTSPLIAVASDAGWTNVWDRHDEPHTSPSEGLRM